jgi:predicted outer membrane repeat protein
MFWMFTYLACQPEVELRTQIGISAIEIDFGEVPVGSWLENSFLIENTGETPIQVLSSGIIGASDSVWNISSDDKNSLEPGDYSIFNLRFSPNQMRSEDVRVQVRLDIEDLQLLYIHGYGEGGLSVLDLDGDGFSPAEGDCHDANPDTHPDAQEICDGIDNDCDGGLPEEEEDLDADGWMACDTDCNDYDNDVYPGAPELCDGIDNDCDGLIQDNDDIDGDGQTLCEGDCNDMNPDQWYGNIEECNFLDSDCNGLVDDLDNDGDGHSMCMSGGDCDDANPLAHPVVFDSSSPYEEGDGTLEYPYNNLNIALENIDELCRTVMIAPGTHEIQRTIIGDYVQIKGAGQYPEDSILVQWENSYIRMLTVKLGAVVDISNVTFFGGDTLQEGAAINVKANGTVHAEDVYFIDNQSNRAGGAVYVYNGVFSCNGCEFSHNQSPSDGGAIYADLASVVEIENTLFSNNSAQQGGAISINDSILSSSNNLYTTNIASTEGGALSVYNDTVINSTGDRFWKNQADINGGAVVFRNISGTTSHIVNAQFQDNISFIDGGAIAGIGNQVSLLLANSSFVSNFASNQGGDVYFNPDSSTEGLWLWSNLSTFTYGAEAFYSSEDVPSSYAFNSCSNSSTGICFQIPAEFDEGYNDDNEPLFVDFSDDNIPSNDDLTLQSSSLLLNSGPLDGQGPSFHTQWSNVDGSTNTRGHTGGPYAE